MTPEQEEKLDDVHRKVTEVYLALTGNEKLGHKGIITRVVAVEKYQEKDRRFKHRLAGAIALATPVLVVLWEWIQRKFL